MKHAANARYRSQPVVSIRNPETMTAEERQREVAQLLARALVRHVRLARSRTSDAASAGPQNDLDLSPGTRLSVAPRPAG